MTDNSDPLLGMEHLMSAIGGADDALKNLRKQLPDVPEHLLAFMLQAVCAVRVRQSVGGRPLSPALVSDEHHRPRLCRNAHRATAQRRRGRIQEHAGGLSRHTGMSVAGMAHATAVTQFLPVSERNPSYRRCKMITDMT